jgi:hypothetical protein
MTNDKKFYEICEKVVIVHLLVDIIIAQKLSKTQFFTLMEIANLTIYTLFMHAVFK